MKTFNREKWYMEEAVPCWNPEFSKGCPYAWNGRQGIKCPKECNHECKKDYGVEPASN